MSDDLVESTQARVEKLLDRVDRNLRPGAVRRAVYRALVLTDGQVVDDPSLAAALARTASHTLATSKRPSAAGLAPSDSQRPPGEILAQQNLAEERACVARADRVDTALVALHAARQLLERTRLTRENLGSVQPMLKAGDELARPGQHALIREAALELMAAALRQIPVAERAPLLEVDGLRRLRRHALGQTASRHVQCSAWNCLVLVLGTEIEKDLQDIFAQPRGPDAALVRHHALRLIAHCPLEPNTAAELVQRQYKDDSEHVRQGVVLALCQLAAKEPMLHAELCNFALQDGCPRIAGLAVVQLARATAKQQPRARNALLPLLNYCSRHESRTLHRAALAAVQLITRDSVGQALLGDASRALQELVNGSAIDSAELAATMARRLAVESHPTSRGLLAELKHLCQLHPEGKKFTLQVPETLSQDELWQVAYVAAARDLPLQLQRKTGGSYSIRRGEKRGFRLWRVLYELRHFSPSKRQSYLHSHARLPQPDPSTVPIRLAEVTATTVPGERRAILGQSWGCFLPRVDDLLSACHTPEGKQLVTPFGVLVIRAPESWLRRLWLRLVLVHRHAKLCSLRDIALASLQPEVQKSFSRSIGALGFTLERRATNINTGTLKVSTAAPASHCYFQAVPLTWVLWFEDALQYVVSPSGNTAWHLAVVVWLVLTAMLVRSGRVQQRFAESKRQISLSVGGWGSRGKSGTERLKSALFQSLHLDVVSKTTGCEAMLIVARRGQMARELFLYRPYDKATIWEQELSVGYAQRLGAQVFLWECMALNPEFVDILNREWMQDSITTITNTYPDHEDIMGPSGEDVARTVARFVPQQGTVLSSEDQMQAFVRESAARSGSQLIDVDELSADLLPHDLLERFPYQEHPRNIALTLRLAESFGLDAQRTLYDLADHVVPDLGVLKTFPLLDYKSRTLVFSNGMSANERAGFLSNWERLEFSLHDCDSVPLTHTVALLNNRADRVARSRVFAELCARDITVDRLVVIGTNGPGLRRFLEKAAEAEARELSPPQSREDQNQWLDDLFERLGAPRSLQTIHARVIRLSESCGQTELPASALLLFEQLAKLQTPSNASSSQYLPELADSIPGWVAQVQRWLAPVSEALAGQGSQGATWQCTQKGRRTEIGQWLLEIVYPWVIYRHCLAVLDASERDLTPLTTAVREAFCNLFARKIVVMANTEAKGDDVLDFVFQQIPPGLHGKVLGCQNIKGTGLDFIYRFMSLQKVSDTLDPWEHSPGERVNVLEQLRTLPPLGFFDCQLLIKRAQTLLAKAPREDAQWQQVAEVLQDLVCDWKLRRSQLATHLGSNRHKARWLTVIGWLEPLVDNLDAISRRKHADGIMNRLIHGQIDISTASEALREVVARQKGGWLARDLEGYWTRLRHGAKADHSKA